MQIVFMKQKLKTCLPSLKENFSRKLKSIVVYKLECSGRKSIFVGQTVRLFTTWVEEQGKTDTAVGQILHS